MWLKYFAALATRFDLLSCQNLEPLSFFLILDITPSYISHFVAITTSKIGLQGVTKSYESVKMAILTTNIIVTFVSTCVLWHNCAAANDSPVVNIDGWGMARGSQYSMLGLPVNVFLGIPFAQSPTKDLRFEPPSTTPRPWSGIKSFTKPSNWCVQPESGNLFDASDAVFDEDCLYLNVYTPGNVTSSSKLAVMVWIHGGGFFMGSGIEHDGAMLASQQQIVVVTLNYRLGVLGFLNIPGTTTTGNYGLLDQVAALQWVRYNIESFGGDPEMVTTFGESAGAASVSLHVLSPLSKGLFKRAISESGVATAYWAVTPTRLDKQPDVKAFSAGLGCHEHDSSKLLECLSPSRQLKFYHIKSRSSGRGSSLGSFPLWVHQTSITIL